ncbi:tRNA glutamyl-Q(34) synthetase GluQRS [Xylophilus sp. ASV27]|uniref:tRNA glutamyl-Q(34) synthetase GluQRS n=1 Tax=Xylophilus sp. ASV27 TaxID=2795129 RepID=UPI0018EC3B84|nr:tRNA glutamyl-Q(34) synthetase GluQRS [Xylophilus sp. ASV27]
MGGGEARAAASRGAHGYVGRFAPSPTGPLHAGSLVAALASWLDARAHHGRWLVRIEDVDTPRCLPGAAQTILAQLAACALVPDEPPVWQSARGGLYAGALQSLAARGLAYPCGCSRREIEQAQAARGLRRRRHAALPYPGTCRGGLQGKTARAWRLRTDVLEPKVAEALEGSGFFAINFEENDPLLHWQDRALGPQAQDVEREVGDFVLRRSDGLFAYQLAVVVDDAAQGVTDVVRGADLLDNTPRQILLQRALGLPTPRYLHTPLVLAEDGQKLSKQNGARPFDAQRPAAALAAAARVLGLPAGPATDPPAALLARWVPAWSLRCATHGRLLQSGG